MIAIIEKIKIAVDVVRLCLMVTDHYIAKYWPMFIGATIGSCELLSVYLSSKTLVVSMFSFELFIVLAVIALAAYHFTNKHLKKWGKSE